MCLLRGTSWIFICFVRMWEQTAIISVYSINLSVSITEAECLPRGTSWVFKSDSYSFFLKRQILGRHDCTNSCRQVAVATEFLRWRRIFLGPEDWSSIVPLLLWFEFCNVSEIKKKKRICAHIPNHSIPCVNPPPPKLPPNNNDDSYVLRKICVGGTWYFPKQHSSVSLL